MSNAPRPAEAVDPGHHGAGTHRLLALGPTVALALQFEHDATGRAGFHAAVFGLSDDGPVVISDTEIATPRRWELRTSGLWAEQICERSFAHWSYGLEAFALIIDEPDELLAKAVGHRVALGWELDFVSEAQPVTEGDDSAYSQVGTIDGLVLTKQGDLAVAGPAVRSYWSGPTPLDSGFASLADDIAGGSVQPDQSSQRPGAVLPTLTGDWVISEPPSFG